jgi:hypothetical protein
MYYYQCCYIYYYYHLQLLLYTTTAAVPTITTNATSNRATTNATTFIIHLKHLCYGVPERRASKKFAKVSQVQHKILLIKRMNWRPSYVSKMQYFKFSDTM